MEETTTTTPTTEPAGAPEGAAPATEPAPQASEPAAGGEPQVETFDRPYVESLRGEAAKYRTELRAYEAAFEKYSPQEREALFELVSGLADPDRQKLTAQQWKDIAEKILAAEGPTLPNGDEDPGNRPLTRKEWEKLQADRDAEEGQARAIKEIEREAHDLGYDVGSMEYSMLMYQAVNPEIAGDLKKADEAVKAYRQKVIDEYTKQVATDHDKWTKVAGTSGSGSPNEEVQTPKTFEDARKAAMAWINARPGDTE